MKCYSAFGGEVKEGIRLKVDLPASPDQKPKYFLHVQPDHYGEVKNVEALIASGCARYDGDSIVVERCLFRDGDLHPETEPDGEVLVLGAIDHSLAVFTGDPARPESFRTAIGPNVCFHPLVTRHLGRGTARVNGHEEYHFLGRFKQGDRLDANIIFEDGDGRTNGLWADGTLLSFRGGTLSFHHPSVIRTSDRFRRDRIPAAA